MNQQTKPPKFEALESEGAWGVQQALSLAGPKESKGQRIKPSLLYDAMFTEGTARRLAHLSNQFPDRDWLAQREVLEAEGCDLPNPTE